MAVFQLGVTLVVPSWIRRIEPNGVLWVITEKSSVSCDRSSGSASRRALEVSQACS